MKINTTLTQLNLSCNWNTNNWYNEECYKKKWTDNWIGDKGANMISESLKINSTLTVLDLGGNWNTNNW